MLHDNSDKGEGTLNWLAKEKLLSILRKLWMDDGVSDSCLLPYLIIMLPGTRTLGQSLKISLTGTTSYCCGTQLTTGELPSFQMSCSSWLPPPAVREGSELPGLHLLREPFGGAQSHLLIHFKFCY